MKKSLYNGLEIGDVILLSDGRLARVTSELKKFSSGMEYFMLQFIDMSGEAMQEDDGTLDIERNLGQSEEILSNFYTTRSIHMALDDLPL